MHGLKPKANNYTFDFYSSSFIFFLCNLISFKNSSLIIQINRFPFKCNFRIAQSSKTHFFLSFEETLTCKVNCSFKFILKKGTVTLSLNNNLIYKKQKRHSQTMPYIEKLVYYYIYFCNI